MAMSKDEFLSRMERVLAPLAPHERIDILGDYVEHFRAGEESGKTAEEIAEALGDPEELARTYLEQRESESTAIPPASAAGTGVIPPMPSIPPVAPVVPPVQTNVPLYTSPAGAPRAYTSPAASASGAAMPPPVPPVPPVPPAAPVGGTGRNQALAITLVILFNAFIGIPVLVGICSALFAVPGMALACLGGGIGLFVTAGLLPTSALTSAVVFFGIALLALCALLIVATIALVWVMVKVISRYVRLCIRICKEGRWPSGNPVPQKPEGGCL